MRAILISGPPGSGKTTLAREAARMLESLGCRVDGVYAPEVRVGGRRVGFNICAIRGTPCWRLARVSCDSPVRVGRYRVCVDEASGAGDYLLGSLDRSNVIIIDEIGPMELAVPDLVKAIEQIISSPQTRLVAVIHRRLSSAHPILYRKLASLGPIVWVTRDSRERARLAVLSHAEVLAREACGHKGGKSITQDSRSFGS